MGPCNWPLDYSSCGECSALPPADGTPTEQAERLKYEEMATDFLWNWTGGKFGLCDVTIRPCVQTCTEFQSTWHGSGPFSHLEAGSVRPVLVDGLWYNVSCGRCTSKCGCSEGATLKLPGPVASIDSVSENGDLVPATDYEVQNGRYLVRLDGQQWSECDLEITYSQGVPVPAGGQIAAGILACEFAKSACGDSSCALPKRVQVIQREGVTIAAMIDQFEDIAKGKTGIWLIDAWVASVTQMPIRSSVRSPDIPVVRNRRTTWKAP